MPNQRFAGPVHQYGTNLTPHESSQIDQRIADALDEQEIKRRRMAVLEEIDEEESHIARRVAIVSSIAMFCLLAMFLGVGAHAQTVNRQVVLTWVAPTACEGGSPITNCPIRGYSVQRLSGTTWVEIGTTTASVKTYTDSNLALGTYTYRVLATSDAGPSAPSDQASRVIDVPGKPGSIVITVTVTVTP